LAKVANVADAANRAKFPEFIHNIKANDGYVFTAPVGQFKPNAFGLYDMHGNAYQWCADKFGEDYYDESPVDDPKGPRTIEHDRRVVRGGSWAIEPYCDRSASRTFWASNTHYDFIGFRVAMTP
jgi:formylglycine-generating enzyme required for sulfatase activity